MQVSKKINLSMSRLLIDSSWMLIKDFEIELLDVKINIMKYEFILVASEPSPVPRKIRDVNH